MAASEGFARRPFCPAGVGRPASDTSRLLRYWRRGRRTVEGSAVRASRATAATSACARAARRDTHEPCIGIESDAGRRGAVRAPSSRSLPSAGDGRRETVPRRHLRQCHWQRDWTRRPSCSGHASAATIVRKAPYRRLVSSGPTRQPDGAHDGPPARLRASPHYRVSVLHRNARRGQPRSRRFDAWKGTRVWRVCTVRAGPALPVQPDGGMVGVGGGRALRAGASDWHDCCPGRRTGARVPRRAVRAALPPYLV